MIKVVTERHCKAGKEQELKGLLEELRSKAQQRDGNYAFETLRSLDDPSVWLVVGTWTFLDEWNSWRDSPARREIVSKIGSLLVEPARESAFEFAR